MMRSIKDLRLGFRDAENYRRKDEKEFFNRIFMRDDVLDRVADPSTFFLCGEKGTGKTAYAVFFANNDHKNTLSRLVYIRDTDYQKFAAVRRGRGATLADYAAIWKVIIYLLLAEKIKTDERKSNLLSLFSKFRRLHAAIDEYYASAFTPAIESAFTLPEHPESAATTLAHHMTDETERPRAAAVFRNAQVSMLYIQRQFEDALGAVKLGHNHILFIDGIDIRPSGLDYDEYLMCVRGLANAIWSVNSDFLPNIKDSKGRMKVVLLLRPDIFNSLGLQNQNNKLRDNSVLLDWRTTYTEYRSSAIFRLTDKLLASQQPEALTPGDAWDYYFPFAVRNLKTRRTTDPAFIPLLRISFYRPRDIVAMLHILQTNFANDDRRPARAVFSRADLIAPAFARPYSEYLLGEVKDHFAFYYTETEYDLFLRFFTYLKGRIRFTYADFREAYEEFTAFLNTNRLAPPQFLESADRFLQFLYELNLICYIDVSTEDYDEMRWCFRERSYSNISPKVRTHMVYGIHHGLLRAIRIGAPHLRQMPA